MGNTAPNGTRSWLSPDPTRPVASLDPAARGPRTWWFGVAWSGGSSLSLRLVNLRKVSGCGSALAEGYRGGGGVDFAVLTGLAWKALQAVTSPHVETATGKLARRYRIGSAAEAWALDRPGLPLHDGALQLKIRPTKAAMALPPGRPAH